MYPITFRRLADKTFAKYQVIECLATRSPKDSRPESLRVDQDSMSLRGSPMPAGEKGWPGRMALLPRPALPLPQGDPGCPDGERHEHRHAPPRAHRRARHREGDRVDREGARRARPAVPRPRRSVIPAPARARANPLRLQLPVPLQGRRCAGHSSASSIGSNSGRHTATGRAPTPGAGGDQSARSTESELPARDLHLVVGNLAAWRARPS